MSEDEYSPTPLQPRRGDLIKPLSKGGTRAHQLNKTKARPFKPVGLFAKLCLIIITIVSFAAIFQSDVLWTKYDSVERTPYHSMADWKDAWLLPSIRSHDPISTSSYFWEQSIPLPTAATHRGINLLLHLVAVLFFLKCLESLKAPGSFAATLVISTHPAVMQTLFWPGYRDQIIGLIFILLALLAGIRNRGGAGYLMTLFFTVVACVIHPTAIAIPVILALVITLQNKKLQFNSFNRVLPLICIALFIGVWTQEGASASESSTTVETAGNALNEAGQNMFYYLKQSLLPIEGSLFTPMTDDGGYSVGAGMSILPFLFFIPFYCLAALNFGKPWARAGILGLTAFLLLSLNGISNTGVFLDGDRALESFGLYVALPAMVAMLFCGVAHAFNAMGAAGKPLWITVFSIFFLIHIGVTGSYAYQIGTPTTMWQSMLNQWPDSWVPKAAYINTLTLASDDSLAVDEQIKMLISVLETRPDLIEERKMLARIYRDAGQSNNALTQFKRILRESSPDNDFLEEAAKFYDRVGLRYDASNTRERKTP
ncbi:MAG TPA: hypothetical protein DCX06_02490 [Opitutae bacterium]|nr:hypothetical protein [Opitutae bacterium]